jgi:translation initiation factor IF-3
VVEQHPMQEGRNMTMMMAPSKAVLAGRLDADRGADAAGADGAPAAGADGAPAAQAPAIKPPAPNGGAVGEQPAAASEPVSVDGSGPPASAAVP